MCGTVLSISRFGANALRLTPRVEEFFRVYWTSSNSIYTLVEWWIDDNFPKLHIGRIFETFAKIAGNLKWILAETVGNIIK